MSVSLQSGARGLERFPTSQNNNVQKQESRSNLGLDAAKNTGHIKKALNKSCSKLNFVQKVPERICLSPSEWS